MWGFANDNGTITNYEETMNGLPICLNKPKNKWIKTRISKKSSLEVYALKGLERPLEVGVHKFHIENGRKEVGPQYKFTPSLAK